MAKSWPQRADDLLCKSYNPVAEANVNQPQEHRATPSTSRPQVTVFGPFVLFLLPLPLLPASLIALARGNLLHFSTCFVALALIALAAKLLRTGQRYQLEMQRLNWSRISRRPWKVAAACCIGIAVTACSLLVTGHAPWASLCFGALACSGMLLTYGSDWPKRSEHALALGNKAPKEVVEALEEARVKIATIDAASRDIHNPELKRRIHRINASAVDILTTIADDPATLRRARRFLNVYLNGVQQVTEGYADVHQKQDSQKLEQNFRNVLVTIEDSFALQQKKMREKEVLDLDVQIEVLNTQLKNEGVS